MSKPITGNPSEEYFKTTDGTQVFVRKYLIDDEKKARAVVHIHHGLGEHSGRYDRFARRLLEEGFLVIVHDARGHGLTAKGQLLGQIPCGKEGAVIRMVTDFAELLLSSRATWPDTPILVLGHSFGTVVSRLCLCGKGLVRPPPIASLVLTSPPARVFPLPGVAFIALLGTMRVCKGANGFSGIPAKLTFKKFQAKCMKACDHSGPVTGWEWLNRDPKEVRKYIEDQFCGHDVSVGWWQSALPALLSLKKGSTYKKMQDNLPVAVFEGSQDYCTIDDKGIPAHVRVTEEFANGGKAAPKSIVYPGARHELLLELNAHEVMEDIIKFWSTVLAGAEVVVDVCSVSA